MRRRKLRVDSGFGPESASPNRKSASEETDFREFLLLYRAGGGRTLMSLRPADFKYSARLNAKSALFEQRTRRFGPAFGTSLLLSIIGSV